MSSTELRMNVAVAEVLTAKSPYILETLLGSCIAIILYDKNQKLGSLAHALLPTVANEKKIDDSFNPKKYVDFLFEIQLKKFILKNIKPKDLVAKLVGGGNMFSEKSNSNSHIGKKNTEKAIEMLGKYKIPIVSKDVGRHFGRKIEFFLETGEVKIYKSGGEYRRTI